MGTISRDQLVKYIKGLEQKVKKYQTELKDRDAEISQLKNKLLKVSGDTEILNKAIAEQSEQKSRDQKARQAEQSQNNQPTETEEKEQITPKFNVKPKLKTKPLENRPASFVKKAAVGTDDKIKKVVRGEKEEEPAEAKEPVAAPQQEPPEPEEKVEEEKKTPAPSVNFKTGEFVGKVLEGEEQADEMKALLERLESIDPKEKRNVYMAMTKVYWSMVQSMGKRLVHENLPWEKRLFLRYGMLDDKLMADRMDVWNQLYFDKSKPEDTGIYFLDEWLDDIARGNLKYSQIDEMALDGRKPDPNASGAVALEYELLNIEQMQRMSVGPRANTVTILVQEYCSPGRDNPTVNRAWLKGAMDEIIKCDYKMFERRHKGEDKVVKPLFIICPGYGQRSGCWEPWSPGKKGDTGPRICLCVFPPRSSMKTLLMGVADYRWEFAKADAMHYWLSEGLTGKWLALFSKKEQRKDLKQEFIDSYYHWVANESRRVPKLEKRFREFLWHNTPFSDEVKQRLKGGGLFARMIELEEAKKKREEEEQQEIERIKAEREARKAARKAKLEA